MIERENGFKTYDPQTGRIVESSSDMEGALRSNDSSMPWVRQLGG